MVDKNAASVAMSTVIDRMLTNAVHFDDAILLLNAFAGSKYGLRLIKTPYAWAVVRGDGSYIDKNATFAHAFGVMLTELELEIKGDSHV